MIFNNLLTIFVINKHKIKMNKMYKLLLVIAMLIASLNCFSQTQSELKTDSVIKSMISDMNTKLIQRNTYDNTRMLCAYSDSLNIKFVINFFENYSNEFVYAISPWIYKDIELYRGYYATYCIYDEYVNLRYYHTKLLFFEFNYTVIPQ